MLIHQRRSAPRRSATRIGASIIVALALASGLTACSGDSVRGDFSRAFSGDSAVQQLDLTTADNMPFTGGVSGTVTAKPGLAADELNDLVARLSAFADERPESNVFIVLEADEGAVQTPVFADEQLSESALQTAIALVADARVESAAFSAADGADRVTAASVQAVTTADALAIAREMPALLSEVSHRSDPFVTCVATVTAR